MLRTLLLELERVVKGLKITANVLHVSQLTNTQGYSCVQTSTDRLLEPCTKMSSTVRPQAVIIIVHVKAVNYAVATNFSNL